MQVIEERTHHLVGWEENINYFLNQDPTETTLYTLGYLTWWRNQHEKHPKRSRRRSREMGAKMRAIARKYLKELDQ